MKNIEELLNKRVRLSSDIYHITSAQHEIEKIYSDDLNDFYSKLVSVRAAKQIEFYNICDEIISLQNSCLHDYENNVGCLVCKYCKKTIY
jgi:hypothetical protein